MSPRGASPKREREFEELKDRFEKEGRYKGRETEVAARIVNKQRGEAGETREAARKGKTTAPKPSTGRKATARRSKTASSTKKTRRSRSA